MYDPTNFHDELNRKVFNALTWLTQKRRDGEISDTSFKVGVISVWNCVSGFAFGMSEFLDDLINKISEIKNEEKVEIFFDESANFFFVVRWIVGSTKIQIDKLFQNTFNSAIKQYKTAKDAETAFEKFVESSKQKHKRI